MNFIFISPHFPESYWLFCQGLKKHGVNVLGIGDEPYESLSIDLKKSLNEYYKVDDLEDYDQMLRAVAYLTFKHGKIDWIESNNEYWLRQDAHLREDFHVTNGIPYARIDEYQSKLKMKEFFAQANIPTARYSLATTLEKALDFVKEVGYPIVIKPNVGVGASDTFKIKNKTALINIFSHPFKEEMIMEEYIEGSCFSFDGITDSKKNILFVTSHQYTDSIMDAVNEQKNIGCYSYIDIPDDIMDYGTRAVHSFDTKSRFFHFEFFRLTSDQHVGSIGDIIGLEVNMRPPGGFLPDMINYANNSNVYQLWADMIVNDTIHFQQKRIYTSGFIGRRDTLTYQHSIDDIVNKYKSAIMMVHRLPKALASAMGDVVIVARFKKEKEMLSFFNYVKK
ncbi:MAG: ATP-grasp domain-containing protein [Longicatena sp.]